MGVAGRPEAPSTSTMVEFEDFRDDGFDGSLNEREIFTEVLFDNNSSGSMKRCLVTGGINFGSDYAKQTDLSFGSNNESSALTSQAESYNLIGVSTEDFTMSTTGDHNMNSSLVKLSGEELSDARHSQLTCRVVESSNQGITSSSYLLKQNVKTDMFCELAEKDISMNILSSSYGSEGKEMVASKTIASPVSQESYVTKLVVCPSTTTSNKSGTLHEPKLRWKNSCFLELDEAELSTVRNSTNDPRPVLRYHVHQLLRAAGWVVGRRKRAGKLNGIGEYIFKSPEGRPIREFRNAWMSCGEHLLLYATDVVPDDDCKMWTDLTQFRSDLSSTVTQIEERCGSMEPSAALASTWCLLDPFANVVFIDKTIRFLKEGKLVKAKRSLVNNSRAPSTSCLVSDDALAVCDEEDQGISRDQSGEANLLGFEPLQKGIIKDVKGIGIPESGTKGKSQKKSKRRSEIRLTSLYQSDKFGSSTSQNGEEIPQTSPSQHKSNLKQKGYEVHTGRPLKKSKICRLKDDDLLISAILKNKAFKSSSTQPIYKSKSVRKGKSKKGSCRLLLRSLNKGTKRLIESKWSAIRSRTVLSWLIHSGVISVNEVVHYRNPKDESVVKEGLITWEGILCLCCNKTLSVSEFKSHAGFGLNRPCLNLFMDSGKSFTLHQLEAWSAEYQARKGAPGTIEVDAADQNDDSCGRCGDVGELICCDNCPSTFHQACLHVQELPEGNWYCPQCTCQICGNVVNEKEDSELPSALKCSQCEHKYHEACIEKDIKDGLASDTWFCGESCLEVYTGLQSRIGFINYLPDGYSWTLLRCIHGDQKVHSAPRFVALKAECNSKLAVALTIMEECFLPMVDRRTGIDMIPHVVYNWGSQFARLNYKGFYTVVLEKDDILMCVASIRIHGVTVAEMPLIATCSKYRRQGMCRRIMNAIEKMLKSFKVEKLVISAIPSLVETWTVGFGFTALEDDEKRRLRDVNLMVFPESVWLKKPLYDSQEAVLASHNVYVPTEKGTCSEGDDEPGRLTHQNMSAKDSRGSESENLEVNEGQGPSRLDDQLPNLSSGEPHPSAKETKPQGESLQKSEGQGPTDSDDQLLNVSSKDLDSSSDEKKHEIGCNLESVELYNEKKYCLDEGSQNLCIVNE